MVTSLGKGLKIISEQQMVIRLLLAAFFGAVIGYERQRHNQPAGLRTHMILSIGAALAMCISIDLAMEYRAIAPNGDPARLAAQVISGIGFLGAGAILKYGTASVKGLTTAASLWAVAIVGLAVGAGHYFTALTATVILLITLYILDIVEKRFMGMMLTRIITFSARDRSDIIHELQEVLKEKDIDVKSINFSKDMEANEIEVEIVTKVSSKSNITSLIDVLSNINGVKNFNIN